MDLRRTVVSGFEVAILAGGAGTRLSARTGGMPKALVDVHGAPLLAHQLTLCRRHGFTRVLLLVHHGHEQIRECFADGAAHGVTLGYALERTPRGTAGALRDALPQLLDTFLVLYGDTYLDIDLCRLYDAHRCRRADATLFVHPNDHPHDSDLVELDENGFVVAVHPHPHDPDRDYRNLAHAASFVLEGRALDGLVPAEGRVDFARDVLPAMLRARRRPYGYVSPEYIKDIGTPGRLDQVERDIAAGIPERLSGRSLRRAVFLDRDGTINAEVNHLKTPNEVQLLEGAAGAVRRLIRTGHLAIVITNQSVIARGELTSEGLERIQRRFDRLLGDEGAYLDAVYVCPHHPDSGFPGPELKVKCACRKPGTGLIDRACSDLLVDRRTSWLVGDTTLDIETGRRAGLRTVLVRTGYAGQDGKYPFRPDYVVTNLGEAVDWILEGHAIVSNRLAPVVPSAIRSRLVLIGGLARSGKSFAAQVLKEAVQALGRDAHVLSMDSWLKPLAQRAEGTGVTSRYDLDALESMLQQLTGSSSRQVLEIPVYDRAQRAPYAHRLQMSVGPADLVIVEGVPALVADPIVRLGGLRVHVEMPEPLRLAHMRADYRWRGESDAAVDARLQSRLVDETPPVVDAQARANFIVTAWTPT